MPSMTKKATPPDALKSFGMMKNTRNAFGVKQVGIGGRWGNEQCDVALAFATPDKAGWYWWPCFEGCLPDSEPVGPFASSAQAMRDADEFHPDYLTGYLEKD